ncbi:MAG TPA: ATP-binding cassette domain-containing protein [Streptosporangiaceae bacterium]|nr:ATP-binding cassette domain-containing protein [Streptosporangiaceae bacterium]
MSEAIVDVRDVFCVHRTNEGDAAALAGTNLELGRGEVLCVLGPSGAGKSTLLRVVAGLQQPSAGVVRVLGRDIGRLPARSRSRLRHELMGFLGQHTDTALSPDLRMRDAVALPLALRGMPKRERRRRVDELFAATALADRADARPAELSGGERQRFALCAALAHRPALLLADEPTGELDDASADAIRALIVELARTNGTSVMLVTHDPATAAVADRTLRIRDGRIVSDRRGGEEALVIDGGWLRLPPDLLTQAGIGRRARAQRTEDGVIVTRATSGSGPAAPSSPQVPPQPPERRVPVRVELCRLTRTYGNGLTRRQVLSGLTHEFAPGQMTVVTGRSGAGKTTLLKLVAGLDRPSSGQVVLDGQPLGDRTGEQLASLRRQRIGYLSQEPAPIEFLSAQENTVLVLRIRGWDADAAAERAVTALTRAGLADRARQRVHRLSAGEAQRLALARALAGARGLLIVDEPTSRQDETNARAVAALLAAAAHADGQTVICATHDPTVIGRADHVMALDG